jgi:hypothetical protein
MEIMHNGVVDNVSHQIMTTICVYLDFWIFDGDDEPLYILKQIEQFGT